MITFDIFQSLESEKDLYEISSPLYIADQDVHESYLYHILDEYGDKAFPCLCANTIIADTEHSPRYRWIEIKMPDADIVAIFWKYFTVFGKHTSYLYFKPISKSNNLTNEKQIFQILLEKKLIEQIVIPDCLEQIDYSNLILTMNEYYCNVKERAEHINKAKWRSHRIGKIQKELNIEIAFDEINPYEIQEMNRSWGKLHGKSDDFHDSFLQRMMDLPGICHFITYKLDGKLVGYTEFNSCFDKYKMCYSEFNRNVINSELDPNIPALTKQLQHLMVYTLINHLNDLGYEFIYIGTDIIGKTHLKEYKSSNYNKKINYYYFPMEKYLCLYK